MLLPRLLRPLPVDAPGLVLPPLPVDPVAMVAPLGGVHLGEALARMVADRASWDSCAWLREPPGDERDLRRAMADALGFRRSRGGAESMSLGEAFATSDPGTVLVVEAGSQTPAVARLAPELGHLAGQHGVRVLLAPSRRAGALRRAGMLIHEVDNRAIALAVARQAGLGDDAIERVGSQGAALVDLAAACATRGVEVVEEAIAAGRRPRFLGRVTRQLLQGVDGAEREALTMALQAGFWHPQLGGGSVDIGRLRPWVVPLEHQWGWIRPLWRPVLRRELARGRGTAVRAVARPIPDRAAPSGAVLEASPVRPEWRTTIEVHMLGPFEVRIDGRRMDDVEGQLAGSLLRWLLLRPGMAAHRDELIDRFWPEADPQRARNRLHVALSTVRRALRSVTEIEVLELQDGTYRVSPAVDVRIDVLDVEREARRVTTAAESGADQIGTLMEAAEGIVDRYRGPLCPDLPYEEWTVYPRERLRMLYADVLEALVGACWSIGDYERCLDVAQRLLDEDPCREDTHRLLMRCYGALGRHGSALRQYESCRRILHATLGAAPSAATVATYHEARRLAVEAAD